MPNYRDMYYHLAGRMATAVDVLEATTTMMDANVKALINLKDKLKSAQQATEEMFMNSDDDSEDDLT